MPSFPSLGSWTTRLGGGLPQLKASLCLPWVIMTTICAAMHNHIEWLQLTMNIVSLACATLTLTEGTTCTEADLSRLPGAYPSNTEISTATSATTTTTTTTTTSATTASPVHGAWAIYNRESRRVPSWATISPLPKVKPFSVSAWRARLLPLLVHFPAHEATTAISQAVDVGQNVPVALTTRASKPPGTSTPLPSRPTHTCKPAAQGWFSCKKPRNTRPAPTSSSSRNPFRWAPYAPQKAASAPSPNAQTPPTPPQPPVHLSKLAGAPSGPYPGLKRLKMLMRIARSRRVLGRERKESWPVEMDLDSVGTGFVFVSEDGDRMSDDLAIRAQEEEDIDMVDCTWAAEMVSPPAPIVVAPPAAVKGLKDQPVEDPSSNEDEFDDDLPPAEEIGLPPV